MNTPKLRFKEFDGEWVQELFGELFSIKNGLNKEKEAFGSGTPIINYMDVNKNTFINLNDISGKVNLNDSEIERFRVKNNDLFFTRTSETKEEIGLTCAYIGENADLVFSGFILKASPKLSNIDSTFYAYYLRTTNKRHEIIKHSSITTRALTSGTLLSTITVSLPSLQEQKKIAEFFINMDKKIQLQQEKINLLKEQKKGYMQQIFNQKIRFTSSNGQEFPQWKCNILAKELFEAVSNKNHGGDLPVLAVTQDSGIVNRDSLERHMAYNDKNLKSYKLVEKNDFVISLRSFQGGIELSNTVGLVSPAYTVFRKKSKLVYEPYFAKLFKTESFIKRLNSTTYGIRDGKAISYKDFSTLKFNIPSIEEQKKVADFLNLLDVKINKEEEKLDTLMHQKQAFMQQMFI